MEIGHAREEEPWGPAGEEAEWPEEERGETEDRNLEAQVEDMSPEWFGNEDNARHPDQDWDEDWEGGRNRGRDRDRHEEGQEEEIWNWYQEEHEEDRAGPTAEETDDWGDWGERVRHFATTDESEGWGAAPVEEATPGAETRKRPRRQGKGVKARKDSHKLQALVASQSEASGTSKDSL